MRDIKTKEKVNQTVKTLNCAAIVADKFRNATVKSKEAAEHTQTTDEISPEEYAVNLVSDKSKIAAHRAAVKFNEKGKQSVVETKHNIQRFRSEQAVKSIRRQRTDNKPSASPDSLSELQLSLFQYINGFYNSSRPHSHNNGLSPNQAEDLYFSF